MATSIFYGYICIGGKFCCCANFTSTSGDSILVLSIYFTG